MGSFCLRLPQLATLSPVPQTCTAIFSCLHWYRGFELSSSCLYYINYVISLAPKATAFQPGIKPFVLTIAVHVSGLESLSFSVLGHIMLRSKYGRPVSFLPCTEDGHEWNNYLKSDFGGGCFYFYLIVFIFIYWLIYFLFRVELRSLNLWQQTCTSSYPASLTSCFSQSSKLLWLSSLTRI